VSVYGRDDAFIACRSLNVAVNKCINWCFVHVSHRTAVQCQAANRTAWRLHHRSSCYQSLLLGCLVRKPQTPLHVHVDLDLLHKQASWYDNMLWICGRPTACNIVAVEERTICHLVQIWRKFRPLPLPCRRPLNNGKIFFGLF